jgi:predicted TPR repeat methyltransferase
MASMSGKSAESAAAKLLALHTSHAYVIDMYDPEFCSEYDAVVVGEYKKCDHLNVPHWLLEAANVKEGEALEVLDLGCGTGLSSELFFEAEGCAVTGVDLTPAMCEEARQTKAFKEVICQGVDEVTATRTGMAG